MFQVNGKTREIPMTCDSDCIHCSRYHQCNSEIKVDEETRDFWLGEEDLTIEQEQAEFEMEEN